MTAYDNIREQGGRTKVAISLMIIDYDILAIMMIIDYETHV